jgi:hypothetical protein
MNPTASSALTSSQRDIVVGGAGYIGSHLIKYKLRRGCNVVTFDSLSSGRHSSMCKSKYLLLGNLADRANPVARLLRIIGRNSAGKSTPLKLLTNISAPTHGSVSAKGKAPSLFQAAPIVSHPRQQAPEPFPMATSIKSA